MSSEGRRRPQRLRSASVKAAIGTSITPSRIFAASAKTAQTAGMTRSFWAKVWKGLAASPKPPTSSALHRYEVIIRFSMLMPSPDAA